MCKDKKELTSKAAAPPLLLCPILDASHFLEFSGLLSQSNFVLRLHPTSALSSLPMGLSLPLRTAGIPLMSGAAGGLRAWSFRFASSTRSAAPFLSNADSSRRRRRKGPMFSLTCHCQRRPVTSCSNSEGKRNRVIVISGPTGAGKSKLALELARRVDGEIISADSVQVYRGLDIGSAKPSTGDRKEVTHHLIDILDPSEEYSVGQFFEDARKATDEILGRRRVPIVVGGTGLYLRWYIYGKPGVPVATEQTSGEAHSELLHLERTGQWDAAVELVAEAGDTRARSLAANDWYRLRRSLEIIKSTGSPPSSFAVPYDSCFFLSGPRVDLYRYIDVRCEEMLVGGSPGGGGILPEASRLLDAGLLPNTGSATRAIGYRQAMEYLLHCRRMGGQCSPGDLYAFLSEFQKASRNFAKRQITWFRNEHLYKWLDASRPMEEVLSFIYDSYKDSSGNLMVPRSLGMKRDVSDRRESYELKSYRPQNKVLAREEDCFHVLEWIRRTQLR